MRSLFISIIIIVGISLLIFADVIYVTRAIDQVTRAVHATVSVEEFEEYDLEEILAQVGYVEEMWRKHRPLIILAVNRQYIILVDTLLANIRSNVRADDAQNYAVNRGALLIALHNIRQIEGFTLEGIV